MDDIKILELFTDQLNSTNGIICFNGSRTANTTETWDRFKGLVKNKKIQSIEEPQIQNSTDILLAENILNEATLNHCIDLADEGRIIFLKNIFSSSYGFILKVLELTQNNPYVYERWLHLLKLIVLQVDVPGLQTDRVSHFESILGTHEVIHLLREKNNSNIKKIFENHVERAGVVSLNQSLLNSLVRRKVDLKTAFQFTQDPEGLDSLLQKVGV